MPRLLLSLALTLALTLSARAGTSNSLMDVSPDGKRAYLTHDYPGTVAEVDIENRKVLRTFKAGECARGIALSHDESTIYVTEFYTARLIALDRASGKVVDSWAGGESENLCRN